MLRHCLPAALALAACSPEAARRSEARGKDGPGATPDASSAAEPAAASSAAGEEAVAPGTKPPGGAPEAGAAAGERRVYAKTRFVWVRVEPRESSGWHGYLWLGGSVRTTEPTPRHGEGCGGSWWAVEPRGFVCVDGERATLDPDDPVLVRLRPYAPRLDRDEPHRYGESRGAPRYRELPGRDAQRRTEWDLAEHQERVAAVLRGEPPPPSLVGVDLSPASAPIPDLGPLPSTLQEGRRRLNPLSTVAWSAEHTHEGRTFLLTADFTWVPKDRVVPYPEQKFQGVRLGGGASLPLAFVRGQSRPAWSRAEDGSFRQAPSEFPRLASLPLTGQSAEHGGRRWLETREQGLWILETDAVVVRARDVTPWGARVGEPDTTGKAPPGRATWIETSVWKGWLVAYEGTRPVFATLVSPGRGGTPERGKDPLSTASTPTGTFPITGKFATATMVAPEDFVHSDVPWTQNFSGPHALHGAYWHDDWGNRKSAGCINLSPHDARWLYGFTDPPVPEGWHGVRWRPDADPTTLLLVRE